MRARAVRLGSPADDVDDIVQETFLQAFVALEGGEPDRFGAWLAGIVRNVQRAAGRRAPVLLLGDWPEGLHPASAEGLPSARTWTAPRRCGPRSRRCRTGSGARSSSATTPTSRWGGQASLHTRRAAGLREHISASRPDLIPVAARRTPMTIVRIAHVQPRLEATLDGHMSIRHILVVLADEAGGRAMGLWLRTREGLPLSRAAPGRAQRRRRPPGLRSGRAGLRSGGRDCGAGGGTAERAGGDAERAGGDAERAGGDAAQADREEFLPRGVHARGPGQSGCCGPSAGE